MSARQLSQRISTRGCLQKTSTRKGLRMTSNVIATFRTICVIVPSQQESPWSCVSPWRLPQPPGFYMRPPWGRRNVTRSLASQQSTCGVAVQGDGWQRGLLDLCVHHGEPCPCLISLQALYVGRLISIYLWSVDFIIKRPSHQARNAKKEYGCIFLFFRLGIIYFS